MASITDNSKKYGEGHKVILKESGKLSSPVKTLYSSSGYQAGKSVFTITLQPKKIDNVLQYSSGNKTVYLVDDRNKVIQLIGSSSAIDGSFNHFSTNAKSNTNLLTEIKENISMWLFEGYFEDNKILSKDEIIDKLGLNEKHYNTTYYQSAIKQLEELKTHVKRGNKKYDYERQGGKHTAKLYKVARTLTKKASDNWNPADVWMIRQGFDMNPLYDAANAQTLNDLLAEAYYNKDILPISLKNVTTAKASSSVVDPSRLLSQKLDLNLKFKKVDLSESFANFIVQTESGFAIRVGFKASATTLNVSIEGRMISAGYQLGAVDAKDYTREVLDNYKYALRSGIPVPSDMDKAKQELKEITNKYPRFSNKFQSYDEAITALSGTSDLTQKRFINLISYLYSFLIAADDFEAHMKFCYFSSKKITNLSGLYLILQ